MSIEINNAKEEMKEIAEKCIRCGLCNQICPVLKILREEFHSPRGMMILLDNGVFEKIVYDCTLCKSCEVNCPLDIKVCDAVILARKILVNSKKELEKNKEMIENLRKTGNILGIAEK